LLISGEPCSHGCSERRTEHSTAQNGLALAEITPLPSALLRERVSGSADEKWFIESGVRTIDEWTRALAVTQIGFETAGTILDFGCGCGRVLGHLKTRLASWQRLIGADVDKEAVDWLTQNFSGVEAILLPDVGASQLDDDSVDLVVSQSVFTHLPEDVQFAWLGELHRIIKPGGTMLTSIHGPKVAKDYYRILLSIGDNLGAERFLQDYHELGFSYFMGRNPAEEALPEYYGTAFHTIKYVEDNWLPARFELKAYLPLASLSHQDIVILRKN
jgi:SAM-dependent methyltransferase